MNKTKMIFISLLSILFICAGVVYATINDNPRKKEITSFFTGHHHIEHETVDAPQHSGNTDAYGCHNGSVPYHCH